LIQGTKKGIRIAGNHYCQNQFNEAKNEYKKALVYYKKALKIYEVNLGMKNKETLKVKNNIKSIMMKIKEKVR